MRTRLTGALGALVITAALLCAMPGLMKPLWSAGGSRVDNSLRPARLRTLMAAAYAPEIAAVRAELGLAPAPDDQTERKDDPS